MNDSNPGGWTTAWMRVVAILTLAADTAPPRGGDPNLHSLALGAQIVASHALALLPGEVDGVLEDVVIDVGPAATVGDLIRAANAAALRDRNGDGPGGAVAVLAALDALVVEAEVVS